jgi:hypothetical protein
MMFLALASVLSPFAMAASTAPDSGLLITRVNSEQWQIRLIAGGTAQQFSGVVESDRPIFATQSVESASVNSAQQLTATSLGTTLAAQPGSVDAMSFTMSRDAKLCLRDAGSSGVHIYRGESLADAVPVTAPLALTSVDACNDATAPVMAASSARKNNVGHWIVLGVNDTSQAIMQTTVQPGVIGLVKRYSWRSLEPSEGVYNFSAIKSDLAWCAAHGMHLIALIEYKTFLNHSKAGPAYLDKYEAPNTLAGYSLVLWNPVVTPRYNALIKALGAQVDSSNSFEGIATQESAMSLSPSVLKAFHYTPELYRDALISMLSTATVSLPTSRVFWYMNFIVGNQTYIGTIAAAVAPKGVVMGGPDVWPDDRALESRTYPFYTQFFHKMPLFCQVENSNYAEPHMTKGYNTKYWTMPELFAFAVTKLHVNYMFWTRITKVSKPGAYDWVNALQVIAAKGNWTT